MKYYKKLYFHLGSTDNISVLLVSLENNKRLDEESVKTEQNLDKEIAKLIDQFLEGKVLTFLDSR